MPPKISPNAPLPRPTHPSYRKHQREFTRQIILPILLVTLLGLGFAGIAIYGAVVNHAGVSLWADIALIWLILPTMVIALIILVLTIGVVYALAKLLGIAPRYTGLVQLYALWLNAEIVRWTEKIVQPVLNFKAWLGLLSDALTGTKRKG
ncbi:MAG: hypothetical protein DDG60_09510 [Anaerolineae bacterium]|nr:MAG: hypothetical protein DDG60_09510 [Anaerolineae bacterium]